MGRTMEVRDAILARDRDERAGTGGVERLVRGEVVGIPTGRVWGVNANPGPLDGQPEHRWEYRATYTSGKTVVFKGMDRQG